MATKRKRKTDTADTAEVDVPDLGAKPSATVTVRNKSHRAIRGVGGMTTPLEVGATTKVPRAFAEAYSSILEIVED